MRMGWPNPLEEDPRRALEPSVEIIAGSAELTDELFDMLFLRSIDRIGY